jgi:hypothetical protein
MTVRQNGDDEGAVSFDPANKEQASLAIKLIGARPKRRLSPEHRSKLLAANHQTRFAAQPAVPIGVLGAKQRLEM